MFYLLWILLILVNIPLVKEFDINLLAIGIISGLILAQLAQDVSKQKED